jgi:hypothetical protein
MKTISSSYIQISEATSNIDLVQFRNELTLKLPGKDPVKELRFHLKRVIRGVIKLDHDCPGWERKIEVGEIDVGSMDFAPLNLSYSRSGKDMGIGPTLETARECAFITFAFNDPVETMILNALWNRVLAMLKEQGLALKA